MKSTGIAMLVILMVGCAGTTKYTLTTPDGVKLDVKNTKDYESIDLKASKTAEGWAFSLEETGVSASDPMKIMMDQNRELLEKVLGSTP